MHQSSDPSVLPPQADQASRLRALMEAPAVARRADQDAPPLRLATPEPRTSHPPDAPPRPKLAVPVVAVASGKGGVGKTNLSVNLCVALAERGLRVTLLDADLGNANADVVCGIDPARRLDRVVDDTAALADLAISAPGGFKLVPGTLGLARMAELPAHDRRAILHGLAQLERCNDLIVVDTAAGVGPSVLGFLRAADLSIVVTTPEPTAVTGAYSLIKCLTQDRPPGESQPGPSPALGMIVNNVLNGNEGESVYRRIANVAARFLSLEIEYFGCVLSDPALPAAVRIQTPLLLHSPRSLAATQIRRVSSQVASWLELSETMGVAPRRGLLGALTAWLTGAPARMS